MWQKKNKIYVKELKINVDICDKGCGGIFFDNREFEKFDEQHKNADEILAIYEGKNFPARNDAESRCCPACKSRMIKLGSGTSKNAFKIDVCYSCGAKFLDSYELQNIRNVQTTKQENDKFFQATLYNMAENGLKDETISPESLGTQFEKTFEQNSEIKVESTQERKEKIANIIAQIATIQPQKQNVRQTQKPAPKEKKKGFFDFFKKSNLKDVSSNNKDL